MENDTLEILTSPSDQTVTEPLREYFKTNLSGLSVAQRHSSRYLATLEANRYLQWLCPPRGECLFWNIHVVDPSRSDMHYALSSHLCLIYIVQIWNYPYLRHKSIAKYIIDRNFISLCFFIACAALAPCSAEIYCSSACSRLIYWNSKEVVFFLLQHCKMLVWGVS